MDRRETAQLCHTVARACTRFPRSAGAGASAVGVALAAFAPSAAAQPKPGCEHATTPVSAASRPELQRAVVCLINQQRTRRGLPRLLINSRLNRSAQGWTDARVHRRDFSHGADFASRISAAGFKWSNVGENIATGYRTPASVMRGWMASAGHCQNILSPSFLNVGIGVSEHPIRGVSRSTGTWTQDFALPRGKRAPSSNVGPASGCPYRA